MYSEQCTVKDAGREMLIKGEKAVLYANAGLFAH